MLSQPNTPCATAPTRRKCLCYPAGVLLHHPTPAQCSEPCPEPKPEGRPKNAALCFSEGIWYNLAAHRKGNPITQRCSWGTQQPGLAQAEVQDHAQALCPINVVWEHLQEFLMKRGPNR